MKKVSIISLIILLLLLFASCSDTGVAEKTMSVDGKNLNEMNLAPGQEYVVTLSEGASFSVGGDGEYNMYSFEIVDGVTPQSAGKKDLVYNENAKKCYYAYSDPTSPSDFNASNFNGNGNMKIKISLLEGDTVLDWDEIKSALNKKQDLISEAFFATPNELKNQGVIDDISKVSLSQTFINNNNGVSGYEACAYGLVIDKRIYTENDDFTQGIIDLAPYANQKIGFYNSVYKPDGADIEMRLNITTPKKLSVGTTPTSIDSGSAVFIVGESGEPKNYVAEFTLNSQELLSNVDFAFRLRDENGKFLNKVALPFALRYNNDKVTLCVYLGEVDDEMLLNFNLRECKGEGPYGSVELKEVTNSTYEGFSFENSTVRVDQNGNVKMNEQVLTAPVNVTLPAGGGMFGIVVYNDSSAALEVQTNYSSNTDNVWVNYAQYHVWKDSYTKDIRSCDGTESNKRFRGFSEYPCIFESSPKADFAIIVCGTFGTQKNTNPINVEVVIQKKN